MKAPTCNRVWEAEAIGDGRLDASARASFERHLLTCEGCSAEQVALARVARAMRELPQYTSRTIARRRSRAALLHIANERLLRGRRRRVRAWAFAATAACVVALAIGGVRGRAVRRAPAESVQSPVFEVRNVGRAVWTVATAAGTVRVALSEGATAIHVEHLGRDQRFFVALPDGDLEVRGTRFQVTVADRRTTLVEVSEGVVALRLLGQPERMLEAGEQWSAPPPTPGDLPAPGPPATADPRAMPYAASASPDASQRKQGPRAASDAPAPAETASAPAANVSTPAIDGFASGVAAFGSGDYSGADQLLATFVHDHPLDARAEDAAFLRSVAHAKMGDRAGAATLARDYLERYPRGLRHKEAERLAHGTESSAP